MVKRNPGMVIYKELNWETLMKTLKDSVKDITVITIILAFSGVFGYGVVFDDLTTTIASALVSITTNKTLLLFLVILFLLLCGMFVYGNHGYRADPYPDSAAGYAECGR